MRLVLAALLFVVTICVSLAEDVHVPDDPPQSVKEFENVYLTELNPRTKRGHSDESVEFKINVDDDSHHHKRHKQHNHHHHHRRHSKESCSDEDDIFKIELDVDESCSDKHHHHHKHRHPHHRYHVKDSSSDEDDTVKIEIDVDDDHHHHHHHHHHKHRPHHHRSSESCDDDSDKTVELKFSIKDGSYESYRHHHSQSNTPQIHYHHHNVPAPEVIRVKEVVHESPEGGYHQNIESKTYSHKQSQHSYRQHDQHDGERRYEDVEDEDGYQSQGTHQGKGCDEPLVCDSNERITILV